MGDGSWTMDEDLSCFCEGELGISYKDMFCMWNEKLISALAAAVPGSRAILEIKGESSDSGTIAGV